eukprot:PLAT8658.1.p1 GENE.PLAT8658.1~~PLAT8658.1.p1  ORF type:complete len:276 (+),score=34.27 PLAT8658.1:267-1094(+)
MASARDKREVGQTRMRAGRRRKRRSETAALSFFRWQLAYDHDGTKSIAVTPSKGDVLAFLTGRDLPEKATAPRARMEDLPTVAEAIPPRQKIAARKQPSQAMLTHMVSRFHALHSSEDKHVAVEAGGEEADDWEALVEELAKAQQVRLEAEDEVVATRIKLKEMELMHQRLKRRIEELEAAERKREEVRVVEEEEEEEKEEDMAALVARLLLDRRRLDAALADSERRVWQLEQENRRLRGKGSVGEVRNDDDGGGVGDDSDGDEDEDDPLLTWVE